jgi:hypothetical protein
MENQPRKKPEDFKQISDPPTQGMPTFTLEDLNNADGQNGAPMYFGINGKVRQYLGNDEVALTRYKTMRASKGPHFEFFYAIGMYDPKYGLPS